MNKFNNYDITGMPPVLSWNPIVMRCKGCGLDPNPEHVAEPGEPAKHCWHLRACDMGSRNPKLPQWMRDTKAGLKESSIHGKNLGDPIRRKKPAIIATQFMGDVAWFTPFQWEATLGTIISSPQHIFIMLSKWPERITVTLPYNVWIGTSVTDQATADERIPKLLKDVKASNKWLSIEPMLGPVDLHACLLGLGCIEFAACGPMTGPDAAACAHEWIADVAEQCMESGVPFYDKREIECYRLSRRREWPDAWRSAVAPLAGACVASGGE